MSEQRRLAAIVSADVAGYSRLMGRDESGTLATLKALRQELVDPAIALHGGRIVKTTGDGLLLEFPSVVNAVRCAVEIQTAIVNRSNGMAEDRRIALRIGINLGDIIIDGDDIFGDGVNIAARLQEIATPGGVCVSSRVHDDVRDRLKTVFEDGGTQMLKNIARPVHVWRWTPTSSSARATSAPSPADGPLALPDKPSIAVLPFQNMSGDPEQEYFADGIAEDILTTLSKIRDLLVIARNSSFVFKNQTKDLREISRLLNARFLLEGSVRKMGNRVRLTAQLIDGTDGTHRWADRFEGSLDDVFELQDKITQEIVTALEVELTFGDQVRVMRKRSGSPLVYEHFLRGRELYVQFARQSHAQARRELERALSINANYISAYYLLGYILTDQTRFGWDATASYEAAIECASRAFQADPECWEGHIVIGYVRLFQRRHAEAVNDAERAVALCPSGTDVHHMAGMIHGYDGNFRMAAHLEALAQRLSPLELSVQSIDHARARYHLGEFATARDLARRVLATNPRWLSAMTTLIAALWRLDDSATSLAVAKDLLREHSSFSVSRWSALLPYRRPQDLAYILEPLRLAGLPE